MEWDRPPIPTGTFSHSPLLQSVPLTSSSSSSFLSHTPPPGRRWSVVHWVGTPAVRCSKDTMQSAACVFQTAGIVLQCLYWRSQANSTTCVLSFDRSCSASRYVRVFRKCLCRGVGRGAVMCVQMASSDGLLLVSSVQSLSAQFSLHTLDDRTAFLSCFKGFKVVTTSSHPAQHLKHKVCPCF